ncbi:HD domain-containing protein [Botrimarina hoheduenensis]|uniref:HD domain protein n=1 Tax=Botrimarina hoheduenensis TaxID=2528000 RepID=A0A5C5VY01_9BACT|nr:HD domain-containing protein [Botrimarina hoheduenensis]TWT43330.1 HD domain protein [Botrimarina hoheduenensis]
MKDFTRESLLHDPVHGYVPFVSRVPAGETSERTLLDHPWLQRLRQIHQLQTAWWVYPSAEHTRFQHVVGAMHMASRAVATLYESLHEVCRGELPSRHAVDCLCRMAALLHDVGHGPFGHFFDAHYLKPHYGLTHETLGAHILQEELGDLLRGVRECPAGRMADGETIDPQHIAMLIQRPRQDDAEAWPRWLVLLRSLFCGLYTVDNLDFVLRDAYMTGYSERAYDLERLLRYSFYSERGLTIHQKGVGALIKFMQTKSELFRAVYFHRTVRAIDKTLEGLFRDSRERLFPGNPLEHLAAYRQFTEWSLLIDVSRWSASEDPGTRVLGERWDLLLGRQVDWIAVEDRNLTYRAGESEQASLFSDAALLESALRGRLPANLREIEMQIDLPRHIYRPDALAATSGQNFQFKPSTGKVYPLTDDQLFAQLPVAHRACRVYLRKDHSPDQAAAIGAALDAIGGSRSEDDLTNM